MMSYVRKEPAFFSKGFSLSELKCDFIIVLFRMNSNDIKKKEAVLTDRLLRNQMFTLGMLAKPFARSSSVGT